MVKEARINSLSQSVASVLGLLNVERDIDALLLTSCLGLYGATDEFASQLILVDAKQKARILQHLRRK